MKIDLEEAASVGGLLLWTRRNAGTGLHIKRGGGGISPAHHHQLALGAMIAAWLVVIE